MNQMAPVKASNIEAEMISELAKSGLEPNDIMARLIEEPERTACNVASTVNGYVIPYFGIHGNPIPWYRVKLYNSEPKYKQIKNSATHIYFPKTFSTVFARTGRKYIIITEGEKKAAIGCKMGFPCVALGGVDAWQNKTIFVPKDVEISQPKSSRFMQIKLPAATFDDSNMSTFAKGFEDLLDLVIKHKSDIYICFDTDNEDGVTTNVQRATAKLGLELRNKGIPIERIKHMILPYIKDLDKVGLDDFLMHEEGGLEGLTSLIDHISKQRNAFPRHPNIREYIGKQLQRPRISRKDIQNLSLGLITELDRRGIRMYSEGEGQSYYFDGVSKKLMRVDLNEQHSAKLQETPFGSMLYRDYGIAPSADSQLIKWMGAQFYAEGHIEQVTPHRIIAKPTKGENAIRYQLNDGMYVKVTGDPKHPYKICSNGTENVLFESGYVDPIDPEELVKELKQRHIERVHPWWEDVLEQVRLKESNSRQATIVMLLYYLSPWFYRWRGMQLPVELIIGESGSGKSTLMEVRLNILQGIAKLRNAPSDLKDWHASVANTGGLHVTDNVHFVDKGITQKLSDEICRLVTETNPSIEQRKYYTNADVIQLPVNSVFAFTAIKQPFQNADLIQRSIILELDKAAALNIGSGSSQSEEFTFDSRWKERQLEKFGGRTAWVAHHLHIAHLFMKRVNEKWNNNYRAKHRLINFEQSLVTLGEIFDIDVSWIPEYLANTTNKIIGRSDWALEGLAEFARIHRLRPDWRTLTFTAKAISEWAEANEEYEECFQLTQPRSLGKYLAVSKYNIAQIAGIVEAGKVNNRMTYRLLEIKEPPKTYITKEEETEDRVPILDVKEKTSS